VAFTFTTLLSWTMYEDQGGYEYRWEAERVGMMNQKGCAALRWDALR